MATTDAIPVIKVLFALHPGMDAMDFVGPLEVLTHAKHNVSDDCKSFYSSLMGNDALIFICHFYHTSHIRSPLFRSSIASARWELTTSSLATKAFAASFVSLTENTVSTQGASFRAHMDFKEAYTRLNEFDVLVIPGGGTDEILKTKSEPLGII
jgi:putative intracellular protease/amidase